MTLTGLFCILVKALAVTSTGKFVAYSCDKCHQSYPTCFFLRSIVFCFSNNSPDILMLCSWRHFAPGSLTEEQRHRLEHKQTRLHARAHTHKRAENLETRTGGGAARAALSCCHLAGMLQRADVSRTDMSGSLFSLIHLTSFNPTNKQILFLARAESVTTVFIQIEKILR